MKTAGKIAILHQAVDPQAAKDELDVLVQAETIERSLADLGWKTERFPFTLDLEECRNRLRQWNPDLVFNIVESVAGDGQLIHLAPSLLDHLKLPYTGCGKDAIYITSNKLWSKRYLKKSGLATPPWLDPDGGWIPRNTFPAKFLLKSVWEHASSWFTEDAVVDAASRSELNRSLTEKIERDCHPRFAELYIPGREFNISVLAGKVMPIAEMVFDRYPPEKLRVLDYKSKWEESTFEYNNTWRRFDFSGEDAGLIKELQRMTLAAWKRFGLKGYARVDFRVDPHGQPWVLEINTNPCLSADAGFFAAAREAGIDYIEMIRRILEDARTDR